MGFADALPRQACTHSAESLAGSPSQRVSGRPVAGYLSGWWTPERWLCVCVRERLGVWDGWGLGEEGEVGGVMEGIGRSYLVLIACAGSCMVVHKSCAV